MKVVLTKDVKDLGRTGETIKVAGGYARNYLLPRRLAMIASEKREKYWKHVQHILGKKEAKVVEERKKLSGRFSRR